jgi:acetolactate synthase small subunit
MQSKKYIKRRRVLIKIKKEKKERKEVRRCWA